MRRRVMGASGSPLWTPANITTALWLDAAEASTVVLTDSKVSQWSDKSGNSRHVVQATYSRRPIYNSGVVFSGANKTFLSTSSSANVPIRFAICCAKWSGGGRFDSVPAESNGYGGILTGNAGAIMLLAASTSMTVSDASLSSAKLNSITVTQATSVFPAVQSRFLFYGTCATKQMDGFRIGVDRLFLDAPLNRYWIGDIYEIISTADLPSNDLIGKFEGYLAHKWNMTANLPSGHPYKTNPPRV